MVARLYRTDSATNILPSIHVYNSLGAWFALHNSRFLKDHRGIRISAVLLTALIILSTMFIKQHSVVDIFAALPVGVLAEFLVFGNYWRERFRNRRVVS